MKSIFSLTNIIIVLVVVTVLAVAVIPAYVGVANTKKANEELSTKIDAQKTLSAEEIEAKISAAITGIEFPKGITAEDVAKSIADAISALEIPEAGLTEDAVDKIVAAAINALVIPEAGLSAADVNKIVTDAIASIKLPEAGLSADEVAGAIEAAIAELKLGLSKDEVDKIVADAIAGIKLPEAGLKVEEVNKLIADAIAKIEFPESGVSAEEVAAAIDAAIAELKLGLSEEEVGKIVADAIGALEIPDAGLSAEEIKALIKDALAQYEKDHTVEALIAAGKDVTLSADYTVEGSLVVAEDADIVINLNGKELTLDSESKLAVYGTLTIVGGTVDASAGYSEDYLDMGIVVEDGGNLTVSEVSFNVNENGKWGLINEAGGTLTVNDCEFVMGDIADNSNPPALLKNIGTAVIKNSTFTSTVAGVTEDDAVIVNFADLTLVNCTVNAAGICVSSRFNEPNAATKIVGGEYTTDFAQTAYASAFYVFGYATLTLDDDVVINVPNADHAPIYNDKLVPGTIVGDGYTVNIG